MVLISGGKSKEVAELLRDNVRKTSRKGSIALQTFEAMQGYYFSATDINPQPDEFRQLVEGVILDQGYLINFTLLTNDVGSEDTKAMISALGELSIR